MVDVRQDEALSHHGETISKSLDEPRRFVFGLGLLVGLDLIPRSSSGTSSWSVMALWAGQAKILEQSHPAGPCTTIAAVFRVRNRQDHGEPNLRLSAVLTVACWLLAALLKCARGRRAPIRIEAVCPRGSC